jgi:anion-transporting  ArsA/GET3 family ATPase
MPPPTIAGLVDSRRLLVCVGPGGVGKTTTAAALGALAARRGRRTLICTIDPAPRLADALGVGRLGAEPRPVPADTARALGVPDGGAGRLCAVRLDTERTFARLVDEQVADPQMRRRIFENTIYRQITTALTGSQEYAAALALYDLARDRAFDVIVLDTPPTANALDFLEAPKRLGAAIESPVLSWFARPEDDGRLFSFQRLRMGGALVLRRLAKLAGSQFLDDVGAFLVDFQGVLGGFLARARAIDDLLHGPDVAFFLVMVPEAAAVDEALFFYDKLRAAAVPLGGFVANRVARAPGLADRAALAAALRADAKFADLSGTAIAEAAAGLAELAGDLAARHAAGRAELARLASGAPGLRITEIPLLAHDADNLAELRVVGDSLLAG